MPSDLATSDLVYTLHEKPTNGSRDQFHKSYKNFLMLLREKWLWHNFAHAQRA